MLTRRNTKHTQQGYTLLETLIATVLLLTLLLPMLQSMTNLTHTDNELSVHSERITLLKERMDELFSQEYVSLAPYAGDHQTVSVLSDPINSSPRRLVYISHYDGNVVGMGTDPFVEAEKDSDLLWIRVEIEATQDHLTTLVRR